MDTYTYKECQQHICNNDYDTMIQNDLDAPMPWIGMYIAAASVVCAFAMTVDALMGFIRKKMWFPCKYFSLNAASLTVLTVAMKLTVDLTTSMMGVDDKIASVSSLVMMSTALGNFMTSLASMENNEIMLNLTALAILVITIAANVSIHNVQTGRYLDGKVVLAEESAAILFMLLLLIVLCSAAVVVPTTKRYIESKYQEMDKVVSNQRMEGGSFTIDELRVVLKKYWMMAETGSPQFVMARSVLCVISGVMCLLMALTLIEAHIRMYLMYSYNTPTNSSNYRWSINWILFIQDGGVAVGTIAPLSRWFTAARFQSSRMGYRSIKDKLKIERYWVQRLVEWRESSTPLPVQHLKLRKVVHDAKRLMLNVCIRIQILIILSGKLVLIFSTAYAVAWCLFFQHVKKLKEHIFKQSNEMRGSESRDGVELDLSSYVLLLEGEPELPKKTLTNICSEVDKLIKIGKRKQPKNIIKLLEKCENFNGVIEFDKKEVKGLHSREPSKCWSLSVVTLTSIAVALPVISNHKINQLLSAVGEGLSFVRLIEKTMDTNGELRSIRNTADVIWVRLELYNKWTNKDIQGTNTNNGMHKNAVQELSDIAEKTVVDFKTSGATDLVMENPLNWPAKVIAANSMYRTCQTILLSQKNGDRQSNEVMFERLSVMIAGILMACFTNLARIITMKCREKAIKERAESVRGAAVLLGESEQVIKILQQHELPILLDPNKAGYIEEWRAFMDQRN